MAGEVASTFLSRLAVPVLYYLHARGGENKTKGNALWVGAQPDGATELPSV